MEHIIRQNTILDQLSEDTGTMILGKTVTDVLHVSPNGNSLDGSSWTKAFQTVPEAFAAASTNANDMTGVLLAPGTYDIDIAGDPTYAANLVLLGACCRNLVKIVNSHASATSILKFTGKVCGYKLKFDLGSADANGIIITKDGYALKQCMFVGEDLTGAATALHIDGATTINRGRVEDCIAMGHVSYMKGLLLENVSQNTFNDIRIHDCLTGIQIINANSNANFFDVVDIGGCALGVDIDAGGHQHFCCANFHDNTRNVDDEVGNHIWLQPHGQLPLTLLPDNFTGVALNTNAVANTWGVDTEILSAASRDNPFRIVGISVEADADEKFRIRLSNDSGATHFTDVQLEGDLNAAKQEAIQLPAGTEEVFNVGDRISGSAKSESGGNTATVWLQVQEI